MTSQKESMSVVVGTPSRAVLRSDAVMHPVQFDILLLPRYTQEALRCNAFLLL